MLQNLSISIYQSELKWTFLSSGSWGSSTSWTRIIFRGLLIVLRSLRELSQWYRDPRTNQFYRHLFSHIISSPEQSPYYQYYHFRYRGKRRNTRFFDVEVVRHQFLAPVRSSPVTTRDRHTLRHKGPCCLMSVPSLFSVINHPTNVRDEERLDQCTFVLTGVITHTQDSKFRLPSHPI